MCSSPCLAYTTKQLNYPLGLMISASHNPHEFNGLKFTVSEVDGARITKLIIEKLPELEQQDDKAQDEA